jgi:hypothetical protein
MSVQAGLPIKAGMCGSHLGVLGLLGRWRLTGPHEGFQKICRAFAGGCRNEGSRIRSALSLIRAGAPFEAMPEWEADEA